MKTVLFQVRSALTRALRRVERMKPCPKDRELLLSIAETVAASEDEHRRFLVSQRRWAELGAGMVFDTERLQRTEAETERVSALLGKVFARDGMRPPGSTSGERFPGLERRHAGFLAELAEREEISAEAFAALARRHSLLPAGAMEAINDWAFDTLGETVLNDGDPVEIVCHLLRPPEVAQEMRR